MMLVFKLLFSFLFYSLAFAARITRRATTLADDVVVYNAPSDYNTPGVLYARSVELADGTLLATWENYSPEPPLVYFPIYKSTDQGVTWEYLSEITDQANDWGLRYQPFLYLLPEAWAGYSEGTLIAAGNSIPEDLSQTKIDVYVSEDNGVTWSYVSSVDRGGEATPNNGLTPVWEPFILLFNRELIVYYSSQKFNTTHGQVLGHKTTTDLSSWSDIVIDTEFYPYTDRPGMTTIAQLNNGKYIMAFEWGTYADTSSYSFPVTYRISNDPREFNSTDPIVLVDDDGATPTGSPYVVYTSSGGENGTIIINGSSNSEIYINQALGDANSWKKVSTHTAAAYSRHLRVLSGDEYLLILSGGPLSGTNNDVTADVYRFSDLF